MLWPDPPADEWVNVDRPPDAAARVRVAEVFDRLDHLDLATIGAQMPEGDRPPYLRLAPDAQDVFTKWRTELERRLRSDDLPPIMEAHLAKYRSLVPSLALLIHLADDDTGPVTHHALFRACAWAEYLESHARRIYSTALNPAGVGARNLAKHIQAGELGTEFALRDVQRRGWSGLTDHDTIEAAAGLLESLDWLRAGAPQPTGGRTRAPRYHVSPHVGGG